MECLSHAVEELPLPAITWAMCTKIHAAFSRVEAADHSRTFELTECRAHSAIQEGEKRDMCVLT